MTRALHFNLKVDGILARCSMQCILCTCPDWPVHSAGSWTFQFSLDQARFILCIFSKHVLNFWPAHASGWSSLFSQSSSLCSWYWSQHLREGKNLDPAHMASVHAYLSEIVAICRHLYSIWWVRIVDIWRSAEYQQEQLANSLLLKSIWLLKRNRQMAIARLGTWVRSDMCCCYHHHHHRQNRTKENTFPFPFLDCSLKQEQFLDFLLWIR